MQSPGRLAARLALLAVSVAAVVALVSWQDREDACAEAGATIVREITGSVDSSVLPEARATIVDGCHDSAPLVSAAGALRGAGREPEAQPLIRKVLREEPDNFAAWAILSVVLAESDPHEAQAARERALELNPLAGS